MKLNIEKGIFKTFDLIDIANALRILTLPKDVIELIQICILFIHIMYGPKNINSN